jgi:hypothetical protein
MRKKTNGANVSIKQLTAQLHGFQQAGVGTTQAKVRAAREILQTRTDGAERQRDCLKNALQAAITLEFATIPPYLTALWSIKDERDPVANSIREVVHEEMLHMALACNMLASIGGRPSVNRDVPTYPGPLPGGVHRGLVAKLSPLTKNALKDFLWIERPVKEFARDHPFLHPEKEWNEGVNLEQDETIGEFYDAIKESFIQGKPLMTPDHQITGPLALGVVRNVQDVDRFIELIKHQGEGSTDKPTYDRSKLIKPREGSDGSVVREKSSHYFRFLEIYEGFELHWDEEKERLIRGKPLPFPEVWKMAVIPKGGYRKKDVSADVWYHLEQFDEAYTRMMDLLQSAWMRGGQASFLHAIEDMFKLEQQARILMQINIPGGRGATYGPCFRYKAH